MARWVGVASMPRLARAAAGAHAFERPGASGLAASPDEKPGGGGVARCRSWPGSPWRRHSAPQVAPLQPRLRQKLWWWSVRASAMPLSKRFWRGSSFADQKGQGRDHRMCGSDQGTAISDRITAAGISSLSSCPSRIGTFDVCIGQWL